MRYILTRDLEVPIKELSLKDQHSFPKGDIFVALISRDLVYLDSFVSGIRVTLNSKELYKLINAGTLIYIGA